MANILSYFTYNLSKQEQLKYSFTENIYKLHIYYDNKTIYMQNYVAKEINISNYKNNIQKNIRDLVIKNLITNKHNKFFNFNTDRKSVV